MYPADDQADEATRQWLEAHPQAPAALRRIVTDRWDDLRRADTAQDRARREGPVTPG